MRKVIVNERNFVKGKWKTEEKGEAIFHQFGCDFIEFEGGPANFTTAIIEWPDGTVENISCGRIRFLDVQSQGAT